MKRRPTVTVRDVADLAGVHAGTVSRALNPQKRHLISGETIDRVEQAARELGYEANRLASGLRTSRSFSVGVLIPDLTNPLFPPMVRGIEDHLGPHGYTALLTNTESDGERERRSLAALLARQVDGFIFAPSPAGGEAVKRLIDEGTPLVLVNRSIEGVPAFAVTPDDRRGAALAVEHLAGLGHRRIAHLGGPQDLSPAVDRHRAFVEALQASGLEADPGLVVFADGFTEGSGIRATEELVARGAPFTAVFAANDLLALDCIDTLKLHRRQCPRDVSVVGFNDMPFADRFHPPLTTVHFSHYEIGQRAAELLLQQITDAASAPRTIVLSTKLVARGSTRRAPSSGATRDRHAVPAN